MARTTDVGLCQGARGAPRAPLPGCERSSTLRRRACRGIAPFWRHIGEAHLPTEQPETGSPSRVPSPDGDAGRPSDRQGAPPQGARPAVGLIWRVRDRATFVALRRAGRRARRGPVSVTWVAAPAADPPRVAYAVGRHVGGSVARYRLRRQLRTIA